MTIRSHKLYWNFLVVRYCKSKTRNLQFNILTFVWMGKLTHIFPIVMNQTECDISRNNGSSSVSQEKSLHILCILCADASFHDMSPVHGYFGQKTNQLFKLINQKP